MEFARTEHKIDRRFKEHHTKTMNIIVGILFSFIGFLFLVEDISNSNVQIYRNVKLIWNLCVSRY